MDIRKLENANMVVLEATRETNRANGNVKLLYKLKVDSVFIGNDGSPKAFFSGEIWTFDATGHAKGAPVKMANIVIALSDLADETAFAERTVASIDTLLFSGMKQRMQEKNVDKLLWVDRDKLLALGCTETDLVTTKANITFVHYM